MEAAMYSRFGRLVFMLAFALSCLTCSQVLAQGQWSAVETALGRKGMEQGGVFKASFARSDLRVTKAGVPVAPGVALTSWMAILGNNAQGMMMGDLVLLEEEVKPVMAALFAQGLQVTALHNHLLGTTPSILYLHYSGQGEPAKLAQALRSVLARTSTPASEAQAPPTTAAPDWARVESVLGRTGQKKGDLIQFGVPRKETIRDMGMVIPPAMGMATSINMQMLGDKAAASGDFVLLAEEVNPVSKALLDGGIEVTAIHSHMLQESPRTFFLHFWGYDDPEKVARGLRAALDATNSEKAGP